jgi:hypothetical protein
MKKQYSMFVFSNHTEGNEEVYNDWYAGQHVHDLLRIPGFVGCRFYKLASIQLSKDMQRDYKYLMIWDIETEDLDAVCADIAERMGDGRTVFCDAFDPKYFDFMGTPITKYITSAEIEGKSVEEVLAISELDWQ